MLPCWREQPSARPSFTNIMASLEMMLKEEGLAEYEKMFSRYMRRLPLIHREREGEDTPNLQPPLSASQDQSGYIRINPRDEGYSGHTTTAGGYIALQDIDR